MEEILAEETLNKQYSTLNIQVKTDEYILSFLYLKIECCVLSVEYLLRLNKVASTPINRPLY
jgi:hypothetical protein